jgi:hypothetical protein
MFTAPDAVGHQMNGSIISVRVFELACQKNAATLVDVCGPAVQHYRPKWQQIEPMRRDCYEHEFSTPPDGQHFQVSTCPGRLVCFEIGICGRELRFTESGADDLRSDSQSNPSVPYSLLLGRGGVTL